MSDRDLMDQLDQMIDALLAGAQPPAADRELAALAAIAGALREMPGESFYPRLKTDLERRASMSASTSALKTVAPIRKGFRTVTPYVAAPNAPELIEFLKKAFDAEETFRLDPAPGGG